MRLATCIAIATTAIAVTGCVTSYSASYPSYESVVAQYVPSDGNYKGEPLDGYDPGCTASSCSCPSTWYHNHWVYYCDGHWIYWHDSSWYHYPYFYVYYWGGSTYVYTGPVKHITKGSSGGSGSHHSSSALKSPKSSYPSNDTHGSSFGSRRGKRSSSNRKPSSTKSSSSSRYKKKR